MLRLNRSPRNEDFFSGHAFSNMCCNKICADQIFAKTTSFHKKRGFPAGASQDLTLLNPPPKTRTNQTQHVASESFPRKQGFFWQRKRWNFLGEIGCLIVPKKPSKKHSRFVGTRIVFSGHAFSNMCCKSFSADQIFFQNDIVLRTNVASESLPQETRLFWQRKN